MTEVTFPCPHCDKVCTRKSSLTLHIRASHPPSAPEFVVAATLAAAAETDDAPTYFPGRDYPDREVWLAKRCRQPIPVRYIYAHPLSDEQGKQPKREPFRFGANNIKRQCAATPDRNPISGRNVLHQNLVTQRHRSYQRVA